MSDPDLIDALTPLQIAGLTIYGEARGERIEGRVAVGCVIRNRVIAGAYGKDYRGVCLRPWQFSCWRVEGGAANYHTVMLAAQSIRIGREGPALRECLWIAEGLVKNHLQDIVRGATHYMTRELWESKPPKWAVGLTPVIGIGGHVFFAEVD